MSIGTSSSIAWSHLPARARDELGQDADIHAGLQEVYMAVGVHGIGPARVETVDLMIVGAVEGAGAQTGGALRVEAPDSDRVRRGGPRAAGRVDVREALAHLPA